MSEFRSTPIPAVEPNGQCGGAAAPIRPLRAAAVDRPAGSARTEVDAGRRGAVVPPMPGKVIEVRVKNGQTVRQGEVLLILEAMKMRNEIQSPTDGTVVGLAVAEGENSPARQPLLFVRPSSST